MKLDMMSATDALEKLDSGLLAELNRLRAHLADECEQIQDEWDGLGRANGQRDDHAACYLARIRPHLSGIRLFCERCEAQLDGIIANPFGRDE